MFSIRDKRFLGVLVVIVFSSFSLFIVSLLLSKDFNFVSLATIIFTRVISSFLFFDDYKLSWSKASTKTCLMKIILAVISFVVYMPVLYYGFYISFNILFIDLIFYMFILNIFVYSYKYYHTVGRHTKTKKLVIYGDGKLIGDTTNYVDMPGKLIEVAPTTARWKEVLPDSKEIIFNNGI